MRIGSLCSGYGGLEEGVRAVLGGEVAWHSEIDPGACKVLDYRYPGVPNLGDMTTADWSKAEQVDVLTGGTPCQDVSAAGKRAGMRPGTRSGLWASMCDAIDIIRPSLVVWENVRGVLSAGADSAVEPCPICVGDERESHLRALGRVVGDLAELGYVGRWTGLRAADVGAPHGRFRVFLTAWPAADAGGDRREGCPKRHQRAPEGLAAPQWNNADRRAGAASHALGGRRPGRPHDSVWGAVRGTAPAWPSSSHLDWGIFESAIRRWERLTRPAPPIAEVGSRGGHRLSPRFSEWLMGLPAGWVTDVPGLTRNEQLKALGNGVVPQQCAAALRLLLPDVSEAVA